LCPIWRAVGYQQGGCHSSCGKATKEHSPLEDFAPLANQRPYVRWPNIPDHARYHRRRDHAGIGSHSPWGFLRCCRADHSALQRETAAPAVGFAPHSRSIPNVDSVSKDALDGCRQFEPPCRTMQFAGDYALAPDVVAQPEMEKRRSPLV
jgi:hypothetical protein